MKTILYQDEIQQYKNVLQKWNNSLIHKDGLEMREFCQFVDWGIKNAKQNLIRQFGEGAVKKDIVPWCVIKMVHDFGHIRSILRCRVDSIGKGQDGLVLNISAVNQKKSALYTATILADSNMNLEIGSYKFEIIKEWRENDLVVKVISAQTL